MWTIMILFTAALDLTFAQDLPMCKDISEGIDWNNPDMLGLWYEVHRWPSARYHCIEFNASLSSDEKTLTITTRRADDVFGPMSHVDTAKVELVPNKLSGYEVAFPKDKPVNIKLLQFLSDAYIVGCGYVSPPEDNGYGFVLARPRGYTGESVISVIKQASQLYGNFKETYFWAINVDQVACRYNWNNSQSRPVLSGVLGIAVLTVNLY